MNNTPCTRSLIKKNHWASCSKQILHEIPPTLHACPRGKTFLTEITQKKKQSLGSSGHIFREKQRKEKKYFVPIININSVPHWNGFTFMTTKQRIQKIFILSRFSCQCPHLLTNASFQMEFSSLLIYTYLYTYILYCMYSAGYISFSWQSDVGMMLDRVLLVHTPHYQFSRWPACY